MYLSVTSTLIGASSPGCSWIICLIISFAWLALLTVLPEIRNGGKLSIWHWPMPHKARLYCTGCGVSNIISSFLMMIGSRSSRFLNPVWAGLTPAFTHQPLWTWRRQVWCYCWNHRAVSAMIKSGWEITKAGKVTIWLICHRPCATQLYKWWQLWPASIVLHEQILNRLELLCSKDMVVSVKVRCEQRRWTKVNRWTSVESKQVMSKPGSGRDFRDKSDGNVLIGQVASGVEAAWSLFRLL